MLRKIRDPRSKLGRAPQSDLTGALNVILNANLHKAGWQDIRKCQCLVGIAAEENTERNESGFKTMQVLEGAVTFADIGLARAVSALSPNPVLLCDGQANEAVPYDVERGLKMDNVDVVKTVAIVSKGVFVNNFFEFWCQG